MNNPNKQKPTDNQIAFARMLLSEDRNTGSPIYNKIWYYQHTIKSKYTVHDELHKISKGWRYSSVASAEINNLVKQLDDEYDGYITDKWKDEQTGKTNS